MSKEKPCISCGLKEDHWADTFWAHYWERSKGRWGIGPYYQRIAHAIFCLQLGLEENGGLLCSFCAFQLVGFSEFRKLAKVVEKKWNDNELKEKGIEKWLKEAKKTIKEVRKAARHRVASKLQEEESEPLQTFPIS